MKFQIIGSVTNDSRYFTKCQNKLEWENLRNVTLYPNLSLERLRQKLKNSLFFLHNMRNEPFDISTAEAMAAGCIPITHNSGGQQEVLPDDELRFNRTEEAVAILNSCKNKDLRDLRMKLQQHAKRFGEHVFRERIRLMLDEYI